MNDEAFCHGGKRFFRERASRGRWYDGLLRCLGGPHRWERFRLDFFLPGYLAFFIICWASGCEKADFRTIFSGEDQDVTVFQKDFFLLSAVDQGAVGACVDQLESVAFPSDFSMFARNSGTGFRKDDVAFRMATKKHNAFGKFMDFAFQRPVNMNQLYFDSRNVHWIAVCSNIMSNEEVTRIRDL